MNLEELVSSCGAKEKNDNLVAGRNSDLFVDD